MPCFCSAGLRSYPRLQTDHSAAWNSEEPHGHGTDAGFPNRKISETLLEFAAPLLDTLRDEAPDREIRKALEVAYTAWNAVIFADVLNNNQYIDDVRRLTAGAAGPDILMERMIARKRELFGDDARLIGDWSVTRTAGGLSLRADARDPHSLPQNPVERQ